MPPIITGQKWRHKVTGRELTIVANQGSVMEVEYNDNHTREILSVIFIWGSWDLIGQ